MEAGQNQTNQQNPTAVEPVVSSAIPGDMLSPAQLQWIDYCAVQGLITEDDGEMHKMSVAQFAEHLGVARSTLYEWRKTIPSFWDKVRDRSAVIFSETRTQKVWNSLYLTATSKLDVRAQQTWLANAAPGFRMPQHPIKHELGGGLADLLNIARERKRQADNVIEGEVVDNANNSTPNA